MVVSCQITGDTVLTWGNLRKHAADFDRHGSIADAGHERSVGRLHDDVGPDAGLALPGIIQHADGEPHDQQDQRHLKRNRHNADQRPDGPVHQVGDDHFVHHGSALASGF